MMLSRQRLQQLHEWGVVMGQTLCAGCLAPIGALQPHRTAPRTTKNAAIESCLATIRIVAFNLADLDLFGHPFIDVLLHCPDGPFWVRKSQGPSPVGLCHACRRRVMQMVRAVFCARCSTLHLWQEDKPVNTTPSVVTVCEACEKGEMDPGSIQEGVGA